MKGKIVALLLASAGLSLTTARLSAPAAAEEPKETVQTADRADGPGIYLTDKKIEESEAKAKLDEPHFGYVGLLVLLEKKLPDHWKTFNTKALLGGSPLGQKKYADAEPLLGEGYDGMKAREKTIPPQGKVRLTEALERLVQLYEATDQKEKAAERRTELEYMKQAQTGPKP